MFFLKICSTVIRTWRSYMYIVCQSQIYKFTHLFFFVCFPHIILNEGYMYYFAQQDISMLNMFRCDVFFGLSLTWSVSHRYSLFYILAYASGILFWPKIVWNICVLDMFRWFISVFQSVIQLVMDTALILLGLMS